MKLVWLCCRDVEDEARKNVCVCEVCLSCEHGRTVISRMCWLNGLWDIWLMKKLKKICSLKLQPQLVFSRGWTWLLAALMRCWVTLSHGIEKILSESGLLFLGVALWRCTVWFHASSDSDSCSDWCNQRLLSGCSYSEGPPPPLLCGSSSFLWSCRAPANVSTPPQSYYIMFLHAYQLSVRQKYQCNLWIYQSRIFDMLSIIFCTISALGPQLTIVLVVE